MEEVKKLLAAADEALDRVSVSGASVYALVKARGALKQAYELLKEERDAAGAAV